MLLNKDSEYNIQQRQQGKDCLSWIENFGLYLFEKECKPKVFFKNGEVDEVLVLRINRKENSISTYHCFFKTNDKGYTRFCINKAIDNSAAGLKELMDKAKWTDESTKEYWKEVFRDGKLDVDEDTLKRPEVLAYADAKIVMIDYIARIKNEFGNIVNQLSIDNERICKVFIVEQYAYALPVQYSLRKIFSSAERNVFGFLFKEWEKRYSWFHKADRFYIPEELLHAELNTSARMTIGDVIKLGENGIIITLPLEKKDGKYCLPSTPIIKGCDLKWNELINGDVQYDYKIGNILFKRLQLSMIADGFQTVYIKCDTGIVACSVYENGKYQIKSLSLSKSEEEQKPVKSKPEQDLKEEKGGTDFQAKNGDEEVVIDDSVDNVSKEDELQESQGTDNTISKEQKNPSFIDYEEKADKIVFRIQQGVKRTAKCLETIARGFILREFYKEIPQNASDSEKEVFWKKKYEGSMSRDWQKTMLSNWKKHGQIEYSNFYSFLRVYQYKGLSRYLKASKFSIIDSSVAALKDIRNLNAHANNEEILGIGCTKILFSFEYMSKIAEQQKDKKLLNILEKYKSEIEKEWDEDFTNYLNSKSKSL